MAIDCLLYTQFYLYETDKGLDSVRRQTYFNVRSAVKTLKNKTLYLGKPIENYCLQL